MIQWRPSIDLVIRLSSSQYWVGYYWANGAPKAVYATELSSAAAMKLDFGEAPFVAQEMLRTQVHYRVVTVGDRAWIASLSAAGRPLDWRQQEEAHSSWESALHSQICEKALALAASFGIGYSSQDWVDDGDVVAFLDLNPGGQWLFLPDEVSVAVTDAIARFLCGCSS